MDLILWRHAQAQPLPERAGFDAAADLARPLTAHGVKQALRMAAWLNRFLPDTTRVLVSPALRTRQTADALGRNYRTVDALVPGASLAQALDSVGWPDSREPVLLVGHQPMLGQVAACLMGGVATLNGPPWAVRKGAVWWLRHRLQAGVAEVVLVAVQAPDRL